MNVVVLTGRGPRDFDVVEPAPDPPPASWPTRLRDSAAGGPVAAVGLVGSLGVLVQCAGYAVGWAGGPGALVLWYAGFLLLVAPFAWLLTARLMTARSRWAGAVAFTLLLHASWLLSSPVLSTRFDESLHLTSLMALVDGDGWFATNTMLPVSPHYPGLELAAAGVHWLTGLPLMLCQAVVVGLARVCFVTALFLLASRIGRSSSAGSVVVLLYAASPQFYFFNAQFSYQTLAIALLMAAAYLHVRALQTTLSTAWAPLLGAQVCLLALAVTHHLTSWLALAAFWAAALLLWTGSDRRRARLTLITAEVGTLVVLSWTVLIAPLLRSYLGPVFAHAGEEILALTTLEGPGRQLLADSGGAPTPAWQVSVMVAALLTWVALLLPALRSAVSGESMGSSRARWLPIVVAVSFPALQLARFSPTAAEVADRASTFVFLAMALLVGLWLVPRLARLGSLVVPGAVVLVLGGTLLGSGADWNRVPGPYLAGAEQRSVDAELVATARWAARRLPAGSRITSDVTITRVLPNFAPVSPVTKAAGAENMTPLFVSRELDDEGLDLLVDNAVDFVIVDTRMVGEHVRSGSFYEAGSAFGPAAQQIDADQVAKFEGAPGFRRVLDGPIRVYDVRSLRGVPQTFADRGDPGLPGQWRPQQVVLFLLLLELVLLLLVSRGWRFSPRHSWPLVFLSLPALMGVGAIGVLTDFDHWRAVALLALTALVPALVVRRHSSAPPGGSTSVLWVAATAVVLAIAVTIAVWSAWHGLFDAPVPLGEVPVT